MAYKIKLLFFSIDPHWYLRKKVHLFCVLLIDVFYCWPNKRKEKQRCEQSFIVRSVISCNRVIFPPQTHVSGPYPVLKVLKVGYCTTYSYRDSKNAISFFGSEGRNAIGPLHQTRSYGGWDEISRCWIQNQYRGVKLYILSVRLPGKVVFVVLSCASFVAFSAIEMEYIPLFCKSLAWFKKWTPWI